MLDHRHARRLFAVAALVLATLVAPSAARGAVFATADAGADHTCAVRPGGAVYCWGIGRYGQLGVIGAVRARTPLAVIGSYTAQQVSSGNGFWCELIVGGKVRCTGVNLRGQLGTGGTANQQYPHDVVGLPPASRIEVGTAASCAITGDGSLYCWGDGGRGEFGDGTLHFDPTPTPQKVPGIGPVTDVSVANIHVCAVLQDRRVFCWGDTSEGKLGNPLTSPIANPDYVAGINDAVQVAAADRHSCALRESRTVWCWGNNQLGQLGSGNNTSTRDPVQVQGLTDVTQLDAKAATSCAVRADGTVWCWGEGKTGELGNGVRGNANAPVQVQGVAGATQITVGLSHACAVTQSLATFCWGNNATAQLGSGGLLGAAGVEPTGQIVQDAVRGTAKFLPVPLAERGSTTRGGAVYLRLLRLSRRGSRCPKKADVTIRARGREIVRTARDIEKVDGGCAVTALLKLPKRTERAFRVVVVVRGTYLKTRKVNLRARVGQT